MAGEGTGLATWRLVAVAGIIGGLAAVLLWQLGREPVPLPPASSMAAVEPILGTPEVTPSRASRPGSTSSSVRSTTPSTTSASTTATSAPTMPAAETEAEVLAAARGALEAWGRFAVTGDLEPLGPWFAADGPQYAQLVEESTALKAAPLGDPPYVVTLESATASLDAEGRAVVEGSVSFTRTGEATQRLEWRMTFHPGPQGWTLWSVQSL